MDAGVEIGARDLTGNTYGELTVERPDTAGWWWCRCSCGRSKSVLGLNLRRRRVRSCGCKPRVIAPRAQIDLRNQRFRLLVVERSFRDETGRLLWFCLCDCGGSTAASASNLRGGSIGSCGCLVRARCGNRDRVFEPSRIQSRERRVLRALALIVRAGLISSTDLARALGFARPSVTPLLHRLHRGRMIHLVDRGRSGRAGYPATFAPAPRGARELDRLIAEGRIDVTELGAANLREAA